MPGGFWSCAVVLLGELNGRGRPGRASRAGDLAQLARAKGLDHDIFLRATRLQFQVALGLISFAVAATYLLVFVGFSEAKCEEARNSSWKL